MYLLDTDTLTHIHAGHPGVERRIRDSDDPAVATTIVTKVELIRGRIEFLLKARGGTETLRAQQLLGRTEDLLARIRVVPLDEGAAVQLDRLQVSKALRKIGRADLLVASIALARRAVWVARNVRHFRQVPGLKVENWVD